MHIETYECEEADGESDCASVTFILNPSDAVRRYETRKFQVEVWRLNTFWKEGLRKAHSRAWQQSNERERALEWKQVQRRAAVKIVPFC
jgi:hypothetical protein